MFVNLQIKSKNQNSLKQFVELLLQLNNCQKLGLKSFFRYFSKKSRRKIFTILQSPHVNKTSQEQFEYNLKSIQLSISSLQFFKTLVVFKKLQKNIRFDVDVSIKFVMNSKVKPQNLSKVLKLYFYKVDFDNDQSLSLKNYMNLLDIYGSSKFEFV